MRTLGILGGIGPESTIDYYRAIVARYKEQLQTQHQPTILIRSVDLRQMQDWLAEGNLPAITAYLLEHLHHLHRGGADFAILAANTAHIVFDEVARQSPVPLISVVEVACQAAQAQGLQKLGLLGTRYTMTAPFYPAACRQHGLSLVIPTNDEITAIHHIYFEELLYNRFLDASRKKLVGIIERLHQDEAIEGLILGGTELPLLLRGSTVPGVTMLDTTLLHVERVVEKLLSEHEA
jgi:aspartate racemase